MKILKTLDEINEFTKKTNMCMLYFSAQNCSACKLIKEKVEALVNEYEKIEIGEVKSENTEGIQAEFGVYTVPIILFYIDGKEVFRRSKYVAIEEIKAELDRYYKLYY